MVHIQFEGKTQLLTSLDQKRTKIFHISKTTNKLLPVLITKQ